MTCERCGAAFPYPGTGRRAKRCPECRAARSARVCPGCGSPSELPLKLCRGCRREREGAKKRRYYTRHPEKKALRHGRRPPPVRHDQLTCPHCGSVFVPIRSDRQYCSQDCAQRAWFDRHAPVAETKVCACGQEYRTFRKAGYCSDRCREAAHLAPPVESTCSICGSVTTGVRVRRYCSKTCQNRAKDRKIVVFEGREVTYAVRAGILRKRRKGPYVWVPTEADACALCGEPIDPSRKHGWGRADPLGGTLGHEPPVAWLAQHPEYSGPLVLRPEHWLCNMRKGVLPDWELVQRG